MTRGLVRFVLRFVAGAPLIVLASATTQGCLGDGFECGRPIGNSDDVRRCDRSLEVCVCATNSCARQVGPKRQVSGAAGAGGTAGAGAGAGAGVGGATVRGCSSGFQYVEAPFAKRDLAGTCVPDEYIDEVPIIKNTDPIGSLCPGAMLPDAGSSAAGTAGMSGSGGVAGASGAGSGGAGASGMGGEGGGDTAGEGGR